MLEGRAGWETFIARQMIFTKKSDVCAAKAQLGCQHVTLVTSRRQEEPDLTAL